MWDWIIANKEWILSGIGVFVISVITSAITFFISTVKYQAYKEKRQEKEVVFKQIISTQAMMDYGKVKALNLIEVVFHDSEEIVNAWRNYKTALKITEETATQDEIDAIKKTEKLLLEKMAKHLKYSNITWDTIDDPYYPKWIAKSEIGSQNLFDMIPDMQNVVQQMKGSAGQPFFNNKKGGRRN
jgi:hypothetical protein